MLLEMTANNIMISLTAMLVFEVVFFISITVIIMDNRKNHDTKHKQMAKEVENLKQLMITDFKDILDAVKDLK